jgi:hypothetical protein
MDTVDLEQPNPVKSKSRFIFTMDELQRIANEQSKISVEEIFQVMGDEGHAILLIFLCLPYLQPIPIPGVSTVFGTLTAIVAFYHYLRKPPYLPKRFKHFALSAEVVRKISGVFERVWLKLGHWVHPRLEFFCENPVWRFVNLFVLLSNAILLALPLPIPFSNFFPNVTILLLALGLMEKDGLFILLSYGWSLLCYGFFIALSLGTVWSVSKFSW